MEVKKLRVHSQRKNKKGEGEKGERRKKNLKNHLSTIPEREEIRGGRRDR